MKDLCAIRDSVIEATYEYNLKALHGLMMDITDFFEYQLSQHENVDVHFVNQVFVAYQNHDYLLLSDLFEYGLN